MTNRLCKFALVAVSFAFTAVSSFAAEPQIAGSWQIKFFLEPAHAAGATQCLVFTKTGGVLGEANSGTFVSPSFPSWTGFWYQEGEQVWFFGFSSSSLALHETAQLVSGGFASGAFNHFSPSGASSGGAFNLARVTACATAAASTGGSDPATNN